MSCSGEVVEGEEQLIQIKPAISEQLKKAKYGVSNHSTVELCHWTKKSFKHEGSCYKHKFYGISTHRCMEFSPAGMHCENRCVYCWRPMEFYDSLEMKPEQVAEPEEILTKLMAERKKLINGYYGDSRNDKQRLDESLLPSHYAISLSGEPTMYPKLPELIKYLNSLEATKSIFLVTNGQEPDMIQRLQDEDALPTQLYLSTNAADYESFVKINKPKYDDSWERWNRTLGMLKHLDTRTVLRITLIRGYNDQTDMIPAFAKMFRESSPHFIEIKSYMHIGRSTNRLEHSNMLEMQEVKRFSEQVAKQSQIFSVMDESFVSRISILQNNERFIDRWIPAYANTN
ncbi:Cyclic pyranopterin monophosphate synthase protein [Marine Group I thaumarchaeote SCGC RSA3]|uniref:S-adenosyl-L-methionine-dependent tRNA 4-demethylwyosine synthase n=3 Tax=Marine Group I TaxID=905826 RepID=A0A081RLY2_9ARCH|nr:tRNA-modifying protein [Marine Group I thaumarchaeote SCGC AAA799-N04]KFM16356.1 Cyclic pyranopterin monophosphate synthase protein [Marine Group I thaumarchaeote SCGC RSA3]